MLQQLDKIFQPKSLAVIGASDEAGSVGNAIIKNLMDSSFAGKIFPVNIKRDAILGKKAYHFIEEVPQKVDLAVICTPAASVPTVVEQCGKAGVGGLVIISAGFKEAGKEGHQMLQQILTIARQYQMRIVGPNCLGFINPHLQLNASFASKMALPGKIAFISQSGALCTSILDWSVQQSVGFSYFVSVGSMTDVGFADLIDYFGADQHTDCILIYMESLENARHFMSAARAFARTKPIIILKAGRSEAGKQATLSHTGSLAGNDRVYDAAFRRAGILRVETIGQLFDCAQSLAMQPRPAGNNLAIITNAGGPGVLATDYLMGKGGQLAPLSDDSMEALDELLPDAWSHANPVDVLGDASAEVYSQAFEICSKDPSVDGALVILSPQAVTNPTDVAKKLTDVLDHKRVPVLASWMGEEDVYEGREILEKGKIPNYRYPENAVDVFLKMHHYSRNLKLLYETPPAIPEDIQVKKKIARAIIDTVLEEGRFQLMENEAKALMQSYGLAVGPYKVVQTAEEAGRFAEEIGFPVVLKIASPDIGHKTDVGGVKLDLGDKEAVKEGFHQIISSVKGHRPDAAIRGVLVEKMIKKTFELLIGANKDPVFGPVIAFGQGGVGVEVIRDTQLGLPPLNRVLARRIIEGTRIYPLLKGYRGMKGVSLEELELVLCKFAYLVMDFPEIKEIDINPFVMDEAGGLALDAHIVLEKIPIKENRKPYEHLVISPFPEQYHRAILLKSGQVAELRPIRPEDEPLEAKMFDFLSQQSLYFRFFGSVPEVTHDFLKRFTHIDYDREMAIIAEVEEAHVKKMIGVVRIIADAWGDKAEFAIVIADSWQRQGLGSKMTDFILEIAKDMGIKTIYASVLFENQGMISLFKKKGFSISRDELTLVNAQLDLKQK